MTDIQRIDLSRAPLQTDIGESAGAGTDIEHTAIAQVDPKRIQHIKHLFAGTGDKFVLLGGHFDHILFADLIAVFEHDLPIDTDPPFLYGVLRLCTGGECLRQQPFV